MIVCRSAPAFRHGGNVRLAIPIKILDSELRHNRSFMRRWGVSRRTTCFKADRNDGREHHQQ
jgi:hypothetical protein